VLHNAIDILGVIVGLLGLLGLWIDPKVDRRKFLFAALAVTILTEIAFVTWEHRLEAEREREENSTLAKKEQQLIQSLCEGDLNYEEISIEGNMGWSDKDLNNAIDDLMQSQLSMVVKMDYVTFPGRPERRIPIRFFHLKDRSHCWNPAKP
jgi:hypothetical protein